MVLLVLWLPVLIVFIVCMHGNRVSVYTSRVIRPAEELLVSVGPGGLRFLLGHGPL